MMLSLITAMDQAGLIGAGDALPWRLPADLRRFRALTWGKPVLVGRRTHQTIGALPGRHHIVLTRQTEPLASGCAMAANLDDAMRQAEIYLQANGGDEALVIGGAEIYRAAMPRCERIYLTIVEGVFAGDVYFPLEFLRTGWSVVSEEEHPADEKNRYRHRFLQLERGNEHVFDLGKFMKR